MEEIRLLYSNNLWKYYVVQITDKMDNEEILISMYYENKKVLRVSIYQVLL